ncbi:hypothetical protein BASA60_000779 [Batrachochytrium salamandrivorans]|nr:hypothetical protein BASA60_000779 [Batrachochytrium salamandrivorans]
MQTEQDYVTSNASQGGIEDDEMFSPGSSTGGSHGTYDTLSKGETLKSQFTSSCRGKKCKLPRMTEREFFLRDRDLAFIGTDGELTGTYSRDTTVVPYTYRGYLDTVKEIEANNDKKRKSGEKQTVTVSKKRKTGRERVAAVFRKMRLNRQKKTKKNEKQAKTEDEQVKTSTRRLLSDKQALQKWKADTTKLVNELKKRLLVSKEDLEKAFEGSGSEGSSTGRSQMPRAQATQLYIDSAGRVSPIKKEGSRENPTSDRGYLKLLSTLSGRERTEWGLKTNTMLPQIFPVYRTHYI